MRLDLYLFQNGYAKSREEAKNLILSGFVKIDGRIRKKPSFEVEDATVEITGGVCPYVSRGAYKLEAALDAFGIDVSGMTAIDIGASTGGFTELLLSRGAKKVYALDSGTGQLHPRLKEDARVRSMEKYNARYLEKKDIGEFCDIAVMDVSFISQTYILPKIPGVLTEDGILVSLIKPQFEAGKENIGKGGIVKDLRTHVSVCEKIIDFAYGVGLVCTGLIASPIVGGDGNREYLAVFKKEAEKTEISVKDAVYSHTGE